MQGLIKNIERVKRMVIAGQVVTPSEAIAVHAALDEAVAAVEGVRALEERYQQEINRLQRRLAYSRQAANPIPPDYDFNVDLNNIPEGFENHDGTHPDRKALLERKEE